MHRTRALASTTQHTHVTSTGNIYLVNIPPFFLSF